MIVKEGETVEGHHLVGLIGEGHYGQVWKAEYLGQPVALKLFTSRARSSHVRNEAIAQYLLGRLSGDEGRFFPRVEHVDLEAKTPYMRMELVDGEPLEEFLADPARTLEERLAIGGKILEALGVVHRNDLVHGDLSPMNVLVTPGGEVKLLDVGFGKIFDEGNDPVPSAMANDTALGVASPLYAAPERFQSEFLNGCGKSSDLFSFGKVLYRLITGENPFVIKPVSRKFPALGESGDRFVFRCLEDRPEDRFADAGEALGEYARIFRPEEAVPGEYKAACAKCAKVTLIPGGWAGELFLCNFCGSRLEVLHYNEDTHEAATSYADVVEIIPDDEGVVEAEARKFCPCCGARILVRARKCRVCKVWVNEYARWVTQRKRGTTIPARDYTLALFGTLLGYFFFWLPGVLMNYHYLGQANLERVRTGQEPPGRVGLVVLIWFFLWLPLIGIGTLLVSSTLFSSMDLF